MTYELELARDALKFYEEADEQLVKRLHRCFDQLSRDPRQHPNAKRLKGPLAGYWRYRIGDWRVVFRVDDNERVVTIILIAHRTKAYR